MTIIIDTINALPDMSANDPATENAVIEAEKQLGLSFADEYKTYILNFGKVTAFGIELTGIVGSKYLNVVKETQQNWNFYTQVPHTLYVIEDACIDGIVRWQNTNGEIFETTPYNKPYKIADSLSTYLELKIKILAEYRNSS